jgi:hypothetical protein
MKNNYTKSLPSKLLLTGMMSLAVMASEVKQVYGATITSLFNTGVDNFGAVRTANGTLLDLHYTLISSPILPSPGAVGTQINNFSSWLGANTTSAWIGPVGDSSLNGPVGAYTYRTTFNLAGFDPSTASIAGKWSTDNNGLQILLNGVNTGIPATSFSQFSIGFAPFTISSGFVSGINTLDFVVNNGGGPTGLRTELVGTATAVTSTTAVPEPSDFLGISLAFTSLVMLKRKMKKKATKIDLS